jgi:hypothetical protein
MTAPERFRVDERPGVVAQGIGLMLGPGLFGGAGLLLGGWLIGALIADALDATSGLAGVACTAVGCIIGLLVGGFGIGFPLFFRVVWPGPRDASPEDPESGATNELTGVQEAETDRG